MKYHIDYHILASKALEIPPEKVTHEMIEDLEYGLAFMVRSPLEYSLAQYLEATRQILSRYKELKNGKRRSKIWFGRPA